MAQATGAEKHGDDGRDPGDRSSPRHEERCDGMDDAGSRLTRPRTKHVTPSTSPKRAVTFDPTGDLSTQRKLDREVIEELDSNYFRVFAFHLLTWNPGDL